MPRKTLTGNRDGSEAEKASMRPRPDAAENSIPPEWMEDLVKASMRPRPDAAENQIEAWWKREIEKWLQ